MKALEARGYDARGVADAKSAIAAARADDPDRILAAFDRDLAVRPPDLPIDTPSLARVEWEHLQRVLTDCDGNISEAARQLGMHRKSLQRKLAKRPASQ